MNEAQSLKPDKKAKKIDSGVFNPPGSQKGCRAEKTEPTREAFWSDDDKDRRPLPVFQAFHSLDCHFFDMRPPSLTQARAFNNIFFSCCRKKKLLPSNTP
jgi:hypothetical protein